MEYVIRQVQLCMARKTNDLSGWEWEQCREAPLSFAPARCPGQVQVQHAIKPECWTSKDRSKPWLTWTYGMNHQRLVLKIFFSKLWRIADLHARLTECETPISYMPWPRSGLLPKCRNIIWLPGQLLPASICPVWTSAAYELARRFSHQNYCTQY